MQLVDVDTIQARSLQAAVVSLTQMLRAGIMGPLARPWAIPSDLGRDNKISGVRRKRFGDQFFAEVRTIGVCGVYEVDAQLYRAAKNGKRRSGVLGRAPDAVTGNAHSSEAKTANREFITQ